MPHKIHSSGKQSTITDNCRNFSHTETAWLNGKKYTNTASKTLTKIKIWHEVDSNKREEHISSFYVTLLTDNGESIEYRYQWQSHNTNAWKNNHSNGKIEITR